MPNPMTKVWVDPPSGWKWGFPKVYDSECGIPVLDWLYKEGVPKDVYVRHTRQWDWKEDDED